MPLTMKELIAYCKANEDIIFVRAQINGKWKNANLREIPVEVYADFLDKWYEEGRLPARVLES